MALRESAVYVESATSTPGLIKMQVPRPLDLFPKAGLTFPNAVVVGLSCERRKPTKEKLESSFQFQAPKDSDLMPRWILYAGEQPRKRSQDLAHCPSYAKVRPDQAWTSHGRKVGISAPGILGVRPDHSHGRKDRLEAANCSGPFLRAHLRPCRAEYDELRCG